MRFGPCCQILTLFGFFGCVVLGLHYYPQYEIQIETGVGVIIGLGLLGILLSGAVLELKGRK